MLDILHIADTQSYDIKSFYGNGVSPGTTGLNDWVQWTKPRGIKFMYIIGVGGGGSGGGNDNTANGTGGGGGGGSGAQTTLLIPEVFVPDTLYIHAGAGGKGLLTASAGNPGSNTYVAIDPYDTLTANLTLLVANGGAGGGSGTTLAAGSAGVGGTVSTIANMPLARGGFTSLAGQSGAAGGTPNDGLGGSVTVPTTGLMVTGGAGGGGGGNGANGGGNGGDIIKPANTFGENYYKTLLGGLTGDPGGAGENGYSAPNYTINYGGAGGAGSGTGVGRGPGIGGDAAPGSGGGGSGAGNPSNPTIKGGEGGQGFVIILCW